MKSSENYRDLQTLHNRPCHQIVTGDIHLSHEDYVIHPFSHNTSSPQQHHLSPLQHPDPERRWRPLVAEDIHFCDVKGTAFTNP
ncbi:pep_M12B_propep domain-containing protein [Caerostris extrusa]|uniref:Pep_M12B_propep domain-containing protein n=1 Tax=Caerostris extrusa TaxID=172846 RepID=A0AAV4WGQ5_CAEEX|nr:pep_M12B_propep domain-containing protein [Caerostris extrusa]